MHLSGSPPTVDLTYSDVFLVPRRSGVTSRLDVDLSPGDGTSATIPLVASNMNSVTGPRLAAALARRGGLGVLPQDMPLQDIDAAIRWVKDQPVRWDSPVVLPASATVAEAAALLPATAGHGIVVVNEPAERVHVDDIIGVVAATRLGTALPDARLGDLARGRTPSIDADDVTDARHACDLIVAAAVGINGDVAAKAKSLAAAGVDVLVIDTAHGHQEGMLRALETVAGLGLGIPIAAGNIVTAEGAHDLVNAGASILKVGVGPGAMCTTRMMTAVGRPQFSAVLETAQAATELGAHVWADGGVRYPRDVALALAAGAASVMIGSWFAGTIEAPGQLQVDEAGRVYKESWGMASTKAVHGRFGRLDAYDRARKELFAEGISSSKIYLDPLRPSVEDLIDMITSGVRSSFTYAGASTVPEFHDRATVGLQSAAGYEEGKALPVSW